MTDFHSLLLEANDTPLSGSRACTASGPGFVKYADTGPFVLISIYEEGYLLNKEHQTVIKLDSYYGDPSCGLIDKDCRWVLMGGTDQFFLWKPDSLFSLPLKEIYDLRQLDQETVEILTDPWSTDAAIWQLNTTTHRLSRIKPFSDYYEKPYTDNVDW